MDETEELVYIKQFLNGQNIISDVTNESRNKIRQKSHKFLVENGELYRKTLGRKPVLVVMNKEKPQQLVQMAHDGMSHFGIISTHDFISESHWWPGCWKDVQNYVYSCPICQFHQFHQFPSKQKFSETIQISGIFERVGIDFVGPLPITTSGKRYLIVATEYLTRWPIAKAVCNADSKTAARFVVSHIITEFGIPKIIQTDRGKHLNNELFETLSNVLHFKLSNTCQMSCTSTFRTLVKCPALQTSSNNAI